MKKLFFPAKLKLEINENKIGQISKKLPKNLAIFYSIQFEDFAKQIKKQCSKDHNIKKFSQILGCSKPLLAKEVEGILFIGSGKFHALSLASQTKKPFFILENGNLKKISQKEIDPLLKRKKGAYLNYLNSEKVGILISTKPGQQRFSESIKTKLKNKKTYYFISNNINTSEFENFKIDSWVNTACPRMEFDSSKIINISEI